MQVVEAAAELTATFVKVDRYEFVKEMFQMCTRKASAVFGNDTERPVWLLISIGIVYQRYKGWYMAKMWFEQALAAAMDKYDENDGIQIFLEEALELCYFLYFNSEGRPDRTNFRVSWLKILPASLYLDKNVRSLR